MKEYTIVFDKYGNWNMNGISEEFLFTHLFEISEANAIGVDEMESETHALAILASNNITVNLLEPNGSPCEW